MESRNGSQEPGCWDGPVYCEDFVRSIRKMTAWHTNAQWMLIIIIIVIVIVP